MDEEVVELYAERLVATYQAEWRSAWRVKDYCLMLVESFTDEQIRRIAKAARMSHRTIFNNATVAKAYPEEERVECLSPRTHAIWHGKRKKEKNR